MFFRLEIEMAVLAGYNRIYNSLSGSLNYFSYQPVFQSVSGWNRTEYRILPEIWFRKMTVNNFTEHI